MVKGDIKRQNLTNKEDAIQAIERWMTNPENQAFIRDSILGKKDQNGERKGGFKDRMYDFARSD